MESALVNRKSKICFWFDHFEEIATDPIRNARHRGKSHFVGSDSKVDPSRKSAQIISWQYLRDSSVPTFRRIFLP
jgi:hypothetical protein